MAKRKKLLKMELLNNVNKAHATSDKIVKTMEEVFETVVVPEPIVEEVVKPEPIVEEVAEKPKTSTRKRVSRTKKTTGV
jgi:hypothetical protein